MFGARLHMQVNGSMKFGKEDTAMRSTTIFLTAALMVFIASCESLTGTGGGGNLLENWRFVPEVSGSDNAITTAGMAPWNFNQIGAIPIAEQGGDGNRGYVGLARMRLVPNGATTQQVVSGALTQNLGTPIRAGHTYTITISGSLSATIAGCGKVVSSSSTMPVRFAAYNDTLRDFSYSWKESPGSFAIIGQVSVSKKMWENYTTATWTADADYSGLAVFLGDAGAKLGLLDGCNVGEAVFLDNVILQEED